jgi:hypothetical protein
VSQLAEPVVSDDVPVSIENRFEKTKTKSTMMPPLEHHDLSKERQVDVLQAPWHCELRGALMLQRTNDIVDHHIESCVDLDASSCSVDNDDDDDDDIEEEKLVY